MPNRHRRQTFASPGAAARAKRHPGLRETELRRLLEARLGMGDRAHPAGQPDLPENDRVGGHWRLGQRRDQGRRDGQIGGRLDDSQAAGDIEINIVGADREPAAGVEHRGDHREARRIPADDRPPRRFASPISSWAAPRTWLTVPGALSSVSRYIVWIESITTRSGAFLSSSAAMMSRTLAAEASRTGVSATPSRSARSRTWSIASSPVM